MAQPNGLDVSEYQGHIDWDALYNNTAFVFIKTTQGNYYVDTQFRRNQAEARRVGMPRGFYHYAGDVHGNLASANEEADWFYDHLGPLQPGEWLILDYEPIKDYPDPVGWCLNFHMRLKQRTLSQTAGVLYTFENLLNTHDWQPLWDFGVKLYPADPAELPTRYDFIAKQIGSTSAPGISGQVDADIFNADNMDSFAHYGYTPPTPPQPQKPSPAPPSVTPETPPTPVKTPPQPQQGRAQPVQKPNTKKESLWHKILRLLHIVK